MFSVLLAALLLMQVSAFPSYALEDWPSDCYVLSEGACLMDGESGVILFDQNADTSYYPASITKVLTALIVLENCDNLSETVTFSYDAVHIEEQNSTIIGASEGDRLSVLDCLYCLLFQSANEVANALAEHVGAKHPELKEKGMTDLQVFVGLMNAKAEELGCTGSHFNNPSGLTDETHFTTPHDMCLIMQAAIGNGAFCDIESHTYWKHAPIRHYPDADDPWNTVYMKHMMLRRNSEHYYRGCIAGKTGYTMTAGNTLVTACRRDGMTLVCCVMNAHANHYNDTTRLFDFGFENFKSVAAADHDDTDGQVQEDFRLAGIPVLDSRTLGIDPETRLTLPKKAELADVTREFAVLPEPEGDALARVSYYYGSIPCGTAPVKLISLGGMKEAQAAQEDPMFYELAGLEAPVPEETETGQSDAGAESGAETGRSDAGAEPGTETGQSDTGAESGTETRTETGGKTGTGGPEDRKPLSAVKIICFVILGIVLLLGGFVLVRYRREAKEEKRRHEKRLERMRKRSDLSGSQQIDLDLEVRRKMERSGGRKRPGK